MTVTFCGNSIVADKERVKTWLQHTIAQLVQEGANLFYLGGYGDFDSMPASVVYDLKPEYPHIESVLVILYLDRKTIDKRYDYTTYPPLENVPRKYCISRRNQWMVDNADVVVAYVMYSGGGSGKTLDYAVRKKKKIIQFERTGLD